MIFCDFATNEQGSQHGPGEVPFLKNDAHEIWACDLAQTYDILIRLIFAFVIIQHDPLRLADGATLEPMPNRITD